MVNLKNGLSNENSMMIVQGQVDQNIRMKWMNKQMNEYYVIQVF